MAVALTLIIVIMWLTVLQPLLMSIRISYFVLRTARREKGPDTWKTETGDLVVKVRNRRFSIIPSEHKNMLKNLARNLCRTLGYRTGMAEVDTEETLFMFRTKA